MKKRLTKDILLLLLIGCLNCSFCFLGNSQTDTITPDTFYFNQSKQALVIEFFLPKVRFNKKIKYTPIALINGKEEKMISLQSIRGDLGWLYERQKVHIEWDPIRDRINDLSAIQFFLKEEQAAREIPDIRSFHLKGSNSAPLGFNYIFTMKPFPVYFAARIGKWLPNHRYTVSEFNQINYPAFGVYEISTQRRLASFAAVTGAIIRLEENCYANFGAGFGWEQWFWKFNEFDLDYEPLGEAWALRESTLRNKGEFFEAGLMYLHKNKLYSLGACTTAFNAYQIYAGISLFFNHPKSLNNDRHEK